jgi:hypothetical protein
MDENKFNASQKSYRIGIFVCTFLIIEIDVKLSFHLLAINGPVKSPPYLSNGPVKSPPLAQI